MRALLVWGSFQLIVGSERQQCMLLASLILNSLFSHYTHVVVDILGFPHALRGTGSLRPTRTKKERLYIPSKRVVIQFSWRLSTVMKNRSLAFAIAVEALHISKRFPKRESRRYPALANTQGHRMSTLNATCVYTRLIFVSASPMCTKRSPLTPV